MLHCSLQYILKIVANKVCEIDVDKWDYFTRDCHALGLKHGFDYQYVEQLLTVITNTRWFIPS